MTRVVQFGSEPLYDNVLPHQQLAEQVELAKANLSSLSIPVTVSELAYGWGLYELQIYRPKSNIFQAIKNGVAHRMYLTPLTPSIYICSPFFLKMHPQVFVSRTSHEFPQEDLTLLMFLFSEPIMAAGTERFGLVYRAWKRKENVF